MLTIPFDFALDSAIANAEADESTAFYRSRPSGHVKEAAGGSEAIEHAAACIVTSRNVVFALVEVRPGFLALAKIGLEFEAVHLYGSSSRDFAREYDGFEGRPSRRRTLASLRARIPAGFRAREAMRNEILARSIPWLKVCMTR